MNVKIASGVLGAVAALGGAVIYLTGATFAGLALVIGGVLAASLPLVVGPTNDENVSEYNKKHKNSAMACLIFVAALMVTMFAVTKDVFFLVSLVVGCSCFIDFEDIFKNNKDGSDTGG